MMKGATKSVYLLVLCVCAMAWKDDTDADAVKKLGESGALAFLYNPQLTNCGWVRARRYPKIGSIGPLLWSLLI